MMSMHFPGASWRLGQMEEVVGRDRDREEREEGEGRGLCANVSQWMGSTMMLLSNAQCRIQRPIARTKVSPA